jgi:hypothetical protein
MSQNKRLYFAVYQALIAADGTAVGSYSADHVVHGLQSCGVNTKFNLEQIFEIGQLAIYENVENLPDIEVTMEKVLDGYPIIYHLATPTVTSGTLAGRSAEKCQVLLSFFDDTKDSASGTPLSEVEMTGMFISQLQFQMPVQGNCTESVTFVGNNKVWRTSGFGGSGRFSGNNDEPIGSGGVNRRENVKMGSGTGNSVFPPSIRGISAVNSKSGYNIQTSGQFGTHFQNIRIQTNFGRENMLELGRRGPYHRYMNFPVSVQTEFETYCLDGDHIEALEANLSNTNHETIRIKLDEGLVIDCGHKNKLESVSFGGANAGNQGGNATLTWTYTTFNDLVVYHPEDPAGMPMPT